MRVLLVIYMGKDKEKGFFEKLLEKFDKKLEKESKEKCCCCEGKDE